jgi:hypothetical protein
VDQSWEYINHSQTHECGNWEAGRAIPIKGIHKWYFPCSAIYLEYSDKEKRRKKERENFEQRGIKEGVIPGPLFAL